MSADHFTTIADDADAVASTFNTPMGQLDTAISTHTHSPSNPNDGGVIDHLSLSNRGANTHAQLDAHLGSAANPHSTTLTQAALAGGSAPQNQVGADTAELAANDTLTTTSSLVTNLNRLRYQVGQLAGVTWNAITRSLAAHTHNPSITGDGGTVVQEGIAYDAALAHSRTLAANPSIKDNLNLIRADVYDLQQGTGFGVGVITSTQVQDRGLTGIDLAYNTITHDNLAAGAVDYDTLAPLRVTARSTPNTKSLILDVAGGVYFLANTTAITVNPQTFAFTGLLPSVADSARIDVLSLDETGVVVRTAGTPGANPVAPTAPATNLPLCQVFLRGVATGVATGIYQSDAATNPDGTSTGYTQNDSFILYDIRPFLNLGGSGGGGGGGGTTPYIAVVDTAPVESPDGTTTTFTLPSSDVFVAGTTEVTVAPSLTGTPVRYTRVASGATTNQYVEGGASQTVVFGVAPAAGSIIRLSYFKSGTLPVANMVWSETPGGTPNGVLAQFTTAYQFQSGSLAVFTAPNATTTAQRYQAGVQFTEDSGLGSFTFTAGNIPATGTVLVVQYARTGLNTNDAKTVSGFPAASSAAPNTLLALNGASKLPASITGDAATVGGFAPSQAPAAGQVAVIAASGSLALPGGLTLPNNQAASFAVASGDGGAAPGISGDASPGATRLKLRAGTGGVVVRNNADTTDLFTVANSGTLGLSGGLALPNQQWVTLGRSGAGGQDSRFGVDSTNYVYTRGGVAGWRVTNNADTANNLLLSDLGALTVRAGLTAASLSVSGAASVASLSVSGAATVTGNLTVSGTLSAQAASAGAAGLMSSAHYNLLAGATTAATGSTLAERTASGYLYCTYLNTSANEQIAGQPYMLAGLASADGFIRTFNPAYLTAGAATTATNWNGHAIYNYPGVVTVAPGQTVVVSHGAGFQPRLATAQFATQAEGAGATPTHSVVNIVNTPSGEVGLLQTTSTTAQLRNARTDTVYVTFSLFQ